MTSAAIQDALVMLVVEREYEKVSMRQIASVAGVGLGTLYLYFPGKDSIAAVTVRARLRNLAGVLAATAREPAPRTVDQAVRAMIAVHVRTLLGAPAEWRALLFLERRISSPASYREVYLEFVRPLRSALTAASDWPATLDAERTAHHAFAIIDAMTRQALLVQDPCPAAEELERDVQGAVLACIRSAATSAVHSA
jgi:AcrR family transcriptional regulator